MSAFFLEDGAFCQTASKNKKEEISGWNTYIGQTDTNGRRKGFGRGRLANGSIFVGEYQSDLLNKGKLYELQINGTFTMFEVEYNDE